MNQKEFEKVVKETLSRINELLVVKGGEYAGSDDRLANFKRGAELTGCQPLQVLHIYLSKHYDAFSTYVRDQASGNQRPRSESISGRLDDIINYCLLAQALVKEIEESPQSKPMINVHTKAYGTVKMTEDEFDYLNKHLIYPASFVQRMEKEGVKAKND